MRRLLKWAMAAIVVTATLSGCMIYVPGGPGYYRPYYGSLPFR